MPGSHNICVGISGGIAAYKSAELVREFQQRGFDVQVVMTRNACEFITPLTMAALSGRKVITGMFEAPGAQANIESAIEHIAVAQSIELLAIVPATANVIARMANGIADDFLTTLYLATQAPVLIAPAMNVNMWEHPAVQENIARLVSRGVCVVEPDEGYLACGMTGAGRLAPVEQIVRQSLELMGPEIAHAVAHEARHASSPAQSHHPQRDLSGETILVTAGPTQEPLDAVRFIGNYSSGKMGYAIASAAQSRGARVVLVSGPSALAPPTGIEFVPVRTAEEMRGAVLSHLERATIVIKAAAVADYRPVTRHSGKIKKGAGNMTVDLERTPDILSEVAARKGSRIVVGFAAEAGNLLAEARRKMREKNLDLVIANDVREGVFESDYNVAVLVGPDSETPLPRMTKAELAGRILDAVLQIKASSKVAAR